TGAGARPSASSVENLAPAPVVVPARLRASRQVGRGAHHGVVEAVAHRRVGFAPAHVEDLAAWVRFGLTARTVRAGNRGGVRDEIRHRSVASARIAISLQSSVALPPCKTY